MTKAQAGGIRRERIHVLLYADDMVIFAETVKDMIVAIRVTKNYFDRHELEFNHKKSKIMTISKGGRKSTQDWKWTTGQPVQEVTEYNYLGVLITNRGTFERHIEKRKTKAVGRMKRHGRLESGNLRTISNYECRCLTALYYQEPYTDVKFLDIMTLKSWRFCKDVALNRPWD